MLIFWHCGLTDAARSGYLAVSDKTGDRLESAGWGGSGTALKIGPGREICLKVSPWPWVFCGRMAPSTP